MDRVGEIRERLEEWGDKGATNEAAEDYRTDIPYLLERISQLERENGRLWTVMQSWEHIALCPKCSNDEYCGEWQEQFASRIEHIDG